MRITTKGRYALRAVASLANANSNKPVSIKQIAETEDISPEFLEQIFFKLKKAGIIKSVRGPGGGFLLSKKPQEITIKDIFVAVGEGVQLTPCSSCTKTEKHNEGCSRMDICGIHGVWVDVAKGVTDILTSYTLEKVINQKMG